MSKLDDKILFGISPPEDGIHTILLGVPEGAWDYMKDGLTHNFDLTSLGLPVRILMYGGKDHAAVNKLLMDGMSAAGIPVLDERRTDFSIAPAKDPVQEEDAKRAEIWGDTIAEEMEEDPGQ